MAGAVCAVARHEGSRPKSRTLLALISSCSILCCRGERCFSSTWGSRHMPAASMSTRIWTCDTGVVYSTKDR